jgi:hypothetical protein
MLWKSAGCAAIFFAAFTLAAAQEAKPKVSEKPLTADQLAIYRSVLSQWMREGWSSVNLAVQTVPLDDTGPSGDSECAKGLDLEPALAEVHRFRMPDLAKLGSGNIALVDPDRQRDEVRENDPERTVGKGKSIEDAVSNGFAHGLFTLSEIRFDKEHKLAVISYGFFCGSLCGNGGTVVLEKTDTGWSRRKHCHDWIS